MEQGFFPGRLAGEAVHVVHRQQVELLHGFQHVRHQRQQLAGGQQAGMAAQLLGPAHGAFQQMAAALAGGAPDERLALFALGGGAHRGQGGTVGAGVEVVQRVALAQFQGQGQLAHRRQ